VLFRYRSRLFPFLPAELLYPGFPMFIGLWLYYYHIPRGFLVRLVSEPVMIAFSKILTILQGHTTTFPVIGPFNLQTMTCHQPDLTGTKPPG
jgi:hypothetical protein